MPAAIAHHAALLEMAFADASPTNTRLSSATPRAAPMGAPQGLDPRTFTPSPAHDIDAATTRTLRARAARL